MVDKPGIVILGGHVQALGLCRIYGANDIPTVVIDDTIFNLARHSKYCSRFFKRGLVEIIPLLLSKGFSSTYKGWLIMPTNDFHIKLLCNRMVELQELYLVGCDTWDKVKVFYHKVASYPLAESLGIPCPKTITPESYFHLKAIAEDLMYPIIIKPSVMVEFARHFHKKVIKCGDKDNLLQNYQEVCKVIDTKDLLIQEIIPGDSSNQYSVGVISRNGQLISTITARRTRQHPIDFGNATTYAETVGIPELVDYATKVIGRIQYTGLAEVEFKYDARDGKYKFLEVNPRTWKWHTLAKAAGIPLLMNFYNMKCGLPLENSNPVAANWVHDLLDIPIKLQMRLQKIPTHQSRVNITHAVCSIDDPLPGMMELLYLPYNIVKRG